MLAARPISGALIVVLISVEICPTKKISLKKAHLKTNKQTNKLDKEGGLPCPFLFF